MPFTSPHRSISPPLRRIVPFAAFILLLAGEPLLGGWVAPTLDPRWLYGVRSGIVALLLVVLWGGYAELRGSSPRPTAWLLGILVGAASFFLWIHADVPLLVLGEGQGYDPRVNGRIHIGFAAIRLAGAALVVPVMEELFWRSFIMRWLERRKFLEVEPSEVGWKALLLSSGVFALEHRLWFAGLVVGIAYGWLYRRTGSLWVVILAHAVTNALLGAWVLATGSWHFW